MLNIGSTVSKIHGAQIQYNTIQYNNISFIADDKNRDREVLADTAATETYYMMGSIQNLELNELGKI